MKHLYFLFLFLITSISYAETTYICNYEKKPNSKQVYEIKENKLYIDNEFVQTKSLKVNKLISEFEYEYYLTSINDIPVSVDDKSTYFIQKGLRRHKVDLRTGVGFEINDYLQTNYGMKDGMIKNSFSRTVQSILSCNGFSINK